MLWLIAASLVAAALVMIAKLALTPRSWAARAPCPAHSTAGARPPVLPAAARYVAWEVATERPEEVLVLDCTHATALTCSHHKGQRNPPGGRSDCSTGLVLDALEASTAGGRAAAAVAPWLGQQLLAVNHFDADAVLSAFAYINRSLAAQHEAVLRHAARIGDLREAGLGDSPQALLARKWDGVATEAQVLHALKLNCWMNSIERTQFSPPYVDKDADAKHAFFLDHLAAALTEEGMEALRQEWEEEYLQVLQGWQLLQEGLPASVQRHDDIGLAVLRPPRSLHYYSAFSWAIGCDTVLTALPGNRFEVESRYTQFVTVHSRPVHARLDLVPLAKALNRLDSGREAGTHWAANSMVDTGPLLRLDVGGDKLPKAQRYGHPMQRPHYQSGLAPSIFEAAVCSYLRHGLRGLQPKAGGWSWDETHALNAPIDWAAWEREVLPRLLEKVLL